jgi:osmoprotectant transport system permease protein
MNFLGSVVSWFRLRENWQGASGIPNRLVQHAEISFVALAAAVLLAVPLAVWLGHKRRFGLLSVNISNIGRAVPSFAILVVGSQLVGPQTVPVVGSWFVFVALVVLAIPPMVTNAYVGMAEVPDDLRDAARGMGLSDWQCLWSAELPVALPLVMAGVRTSAVQVVATATIAAEVGAGGLGRYIVEGLSLGPTYNQEVFAGGLLVALLALTTEGVFALIQRAVTPRGLRQTRTRRVRPVDKTAVGPMVATVGAS